MIFIILIWSIIILRLKPYINKIDNNTLREKFIKLNYAINSNKKKDVDNIHIYSKNKEDMSEDKLNDQKEEERRITSIEDLIIQGFASAEEKQIIENIGMDAIFLIENKLNNTAIDVSKEKKGYDIESQCRQTGKPRYIEVKSRKMDSTTVTITKNEIIFGLNHPEQFILALAFVDGKRVEVYYVKNVFHYFPGFGIISINYNVKDLLSKTVLQSTVIFD